MTSAHQHWHSSAWFLIWERLAYHVALLLACVWSVSGASYYVSTSGSTNNTGAIGSPWPFQYGITNATSGDTVYVREGTYGSGGFTIFVATSDGVTVRAYPYERAIVNGAINATANNLTFRGLEIYNSASVTRTNSSSGLPYGIILAGANSKVINCVIHDCGAPGIWLPVTATNAEVAGNIMWGIGLYQTDWVPSGSARGPILYGQSNGGETRMIRDNIVAKSWTEGLKAYGEAASAEGFCYSNNVAFLNALDGYLIDTTALTITNFWLLKNHSFENSYDRIGESDIVRQNALIAGNTFVGNSTPYRQALRVHGFTNVVITNNLFADITTDASALDTLVFQQLYATNAVQSFTVDGNRYYKGSNVYGHWYTNQPTRLLFAEWQGLAGFDLNGGHSTSLPVANTVTINNNPYESGRANVVVWNWTGTTTETISLAGVGLTEGQNYEIRDIQNWLGTPCVRGVYHASAPTVNLPLNLTAVTQLMGTETHFPINPNVHTPTVFNAFVVLPTGSVPVTKTRGILRKR